MMNREIALAEQRNRVVNASRAYYTIRLQIDSIDVSLTVENKRNTEIDLEVLRKMVVNVFKNTLSTNNDFEVICDSVYDMVATDYPERDIEVKISNNLSDISFTKTYNTTRPQTSIVI